MIGSVFPEGIQFEVGLKHKDELTRYIVLKYIWAFQTKGRIYAKTWIYQSMP